MESYTRVTVLPVLVMLSGQLETTEEEEEEECCRGSKSSFSWQIPLSSVEAALRPKSELKENVWKKCRRDASDGGSHGGRACVCA